MKTCNKQIVLVVFFGFFGCSSDSLPGYENSPYVRSGDFGTAIDNSDAGIFTAAASDGGLSDGGQSDGGIETHVCVHDSDCDDPTPLCRIISEHVSVCVKNESPIGSPCGEGLGCTNPAICARPSATLEASCAIPCETNSDCPERYPHCNVGLYRNSPMGLCQIGRLDSGALCSLHDATRTCNFQVSPNIQCIPMESLVGKGNGVCAQFCDLTIASSTTACAFSSQDGRLPVCMQINTSTTVGICSYPFCKNEASCNGNGSRGLGQYCAENLQTKETTMPFDLCIDKQL